MADKKKAGRHMCPRIPEEYSGKFTGPALAHGDTVATANAKWGEFRRRMGALRPMPRRTH